MSRISATTPLTTSVSPMASRWSPRPRACHPLAPIAWRRFLGRRVTSISACTTDPGDDLSSAPLAAHNVSWDAVTARYLLALLSRSAGDPKAANGPHNPFTPTRASSSPDRAVHDALRPNRCHVLANSACRSASCRRYQPGRSRCCVRGQSRCGIRLVRAQRIRWWRLSRVASCSVSGPLRELLPSRPRPKPCHFGRARSRPHLRF